jgi:hypothetical protein
MKNGWHEVPPRTRLLIEKGVPTKVETTAYDLDLAIKRAGEVFGKPLGRVGKWLTDDGLDPEQTNPGDHAKVTVSVTVEPPKKKGKKS